MTIGLAGSVTITWETPIRNGDIVQVHGHLEF
jgi:hypothetical protein